MIPSRARSLLLVLALVLAACGGSGDPGETLRVALTSYEVPDAGTVRISLDGDVAALAERLGEEELPSEAADLLDGGSLEFSYDGERFGFAVVLDGQRPLELRVPSADELYLRADGRAVADLVARAGEEADEFAPFIGEGGPFGQLLSGEWVRLTGLAELGESVLPEGALDEVEAAAAPDVDLSELSEVLEDVEVVDAGSDGRCGGATRLDVTVGEADVEAAVEALDDVPGVTDLTTDAPAAVDLSAWVDGDALRCFGLDVGAAAARAGDVEAEVADVRGEVFLLVEVTDETTGVEVPEEFEEVDLEALFGAFFGEMLGGLGDMGDMGGLEGGFGEGPQSYGDDPTLDALYDDCEAGDDDACGELFLTSPFGSQYEEFGSTCGGRSQDEECGFGAGQSLGASTGAQAYGDDPELDALWDACEAGDGAACDELWLTSPFGSAYEDFGGTCGERDGSPGSCEATLGAG